MVFVRTVLRSLPHVQKALALHISPLVIVVLSPGIA